MIFRLHRVDYDILPHALGTEYSARLDLRAPERQVLLSGRPAPSREQALANARVQAEEYLAGIGARIEARVEARAEEEEMA